MALQIDESGGVLTLTLDNGEGNLVDLPLARQMAAATKRLNDARCVLLTSTGRNFCLGGNLAEFASVSDRQGFIRELADTVHVFVDALSSTSIPVVGATVGWALGVGLSYTLACDMVVAGQHAGYRTGYPGLGLTPDGGMSWSLPRRVGHGPAMDLLLTGRPLMAEEALDLGLVCRVVPDETVQEEARQLALTVANGPATGLAATKQLVLAGRERSLDEQLAIEAESIARASVSPEGDEGIRAFVERRPADFLAATH